MNVVWADATPLWRIAVCVPASAVAAVAAALEDRFETFAMLEGSLGSWRLEALDRDRPDRSGLEVALALAAAAAGIAPPPLTVEPLVPRDWLAENRERFAPFRIGRFYLCESTEQGPAPPGLIALRVEAATAFGSGRHGSTAGCLEVLGALAATGHRFARPLDLGCGSGILAIATAKLWRVPVLASDVDANAVAVTRRNARLNGVAPLVRAVVGAGWRAAELCARAPFDLVLANILARPLKRMAADLARHLAPGGLAVLAGFLASDGGDVLAAHRAHGLRLVRAVDDDTGWRTLVLRRPRLAATSGVR